MLCHRVQLHEELKNKATSKDGAGIPVVLRVSSRVVDVDCATATITLEDGTAFSGDLVLGADGVSVSEERKLLSTVFFLIVTHSP